MSVRRCPGCHNLVERASVVCPVCGRSWTQLLLVRIARWAAIVAAAAVVAYVQLHRHHQ
jgi:RNA polymerase subunit RPABC4/transcription elongation factor Spt4